MPDRDVVRSSSSLGPKELWLDGENRASFEEAALWGSVPAYHRTLVQTLPFHSCQVLCAG